MAESPTMDSSGSGDKQLIPRFASFKPPLAPPAPPADHNNESHDRHGSDHPHHFSVVKPRERAKYKTLSPPHKEDTRGRRRRHVPQGHDSASVRRHFHERYGDPPKLGSFFPDFTEAPEHVESEEKNDLFFIDLEGDPYMLKYGMGNRYSVPKFPLFGGGRILGLPSNLRIDFEATNASSQAFCDELVLKDIVAQDRVRPNRIWSKLSSSENATLLRPRNDQTSDLQADWIKDFIPFETSDETHLPDALPSNGENHTGAPEAAQVDPVSEIMQRNGELVRAVQADLTDAQSWIRLIDYQDFVLFGPQKDNRSLSYSERQVLADKKFDLYEQGLNRVSAGPGRERLFLAMLEEGAKVWDTKQLLKQWQFVVEAESESVYLRVKYLDFCQTNFLEFNVDVCWQAFLDCMQLNADFTDDPQKSQVQCYLFLRLTLFLREAGYMEMAVGLWQAVLEFTCFRPSSVARNLEMALSDFKDFWVSEVARIGEEGGRGWKSRTATDVAPLSHEYKTKVDTRRLVVSWAAAERERICKSRMPSRANDVMNEIDPCRSVIFPDLRQILPHFWNFNARAVNMLVECFLRFCHLPCPTTVDNVYSIRLWDGDSFLRNELVSNAEYKREHLFPANEADNASSLFAFPHHSFVHSIHTLFTDSESWFSSLDSWITRAKNESFLIDVNWVRWTLQSLVEVAPLSQEFAEVALAVELVCDSNLATKYAKKLLKKRPSLRLYNALALIHRRSGNHDFADNVWITTIEIGGPSLDPRTVQSGIVWNSMIWEMLHSHNPHRAAALLKVLPSGKVGDSLKLSNDAELADFSPADVLRTKEFLLRAQQRAWAPVEPETYVAWVDSLAILYYLTKQPFDRVLGVYNNILSTLEAGIIGIQNWTDLTVELLHQARAQLMYHHIKSARVFKSAQIRTALLQSISLFPENTMFLSLLMLKDIKIGIFDRFSDVRSMTEMTDLNTLHDWHDDINITDIISRGVPVSTHLLLIYMEFVCPAFGKTVVGSIRSAFENAIGDRPVSGPSGKVLGSNKARPNLSLWKWYILYELYCNNDVSRAKAVFYRAIRTCPWSKELIMIAFEHLRGDLTQLLHKPLSETPQGENVAFGLRFDALQEIYMSTCEKDIRLHAQIDRWIMDIVTSSGYVADGLEPGQEPNDAELKLARAFPSPGSILEGRL
ncbi:hypothetical protein NUU61_008326 [Penicillium alfredii]|uniref:DUF1740-domain-containing protein n=1 Tax=Penicillium alfredii TaxID=1506179 RepID=A0A9W9ESD7_9EURO|nr:uncharacterized protein NUU61_008326 [Penicillium alfredii]KAJ5087019.1 hypothetical protein NUU61_008326 [Penicillium alfredii]